jgi:hypothetical protein
MFYSKPKPSKFHPDKNSNPSHHKKVEYFEPDLSDIPKLLKKINAIKVFI